MSFSSGKFMTPRGSLMYKSNYIIHANRGITLNSLRNRCRLFVILNVKFVRDPDRLPGGFPVAMLLCVYGMKNVTRAYFPFNIQNSTQIPGRHGFTILSANSSFSNLISANTI